MVILSGERAKKKVGGGEAVCDYSAVGSIKFPFFGMSRWKKNLQGEAHVRTQGR